MLQKKRDEFRKQIRRTQLDKYREEKRKQLQEKQVNSDALQSVDQIFVELEQLLAGVAANFRIEQHSSKIQNSVQKQYNEKEHEATFYDIMQCFQRLKCLAPYDFEQLFTRYMMDAVSAQRVIGLLVDLVENEYAQNDDNDDEQHELHQAHLHYNNMTTAKYSSLVQSRVVYELVKFIDTIGLMAVEHAIVKRIIDGLWTLLTQGVDIVFSEVDSYGCLRYVLSTLAKLLEDTKHDGVYKYLEQKGIGSQLVTVIDRLRKIEAPLDVHSQLLHVIDNYLACEMTFEHGVSTVGDVTLQTSKVNQKQILLVYCIVFIDRLEQSLYAVVFACLSKLLELHEFLVDNLKEEYWTKVLKLVLHDKRDVQISALELLNDFTFHSQRVLDYLGRECQLLDVLHARLMVEKQVNDDKVTPNVEKIAYVMCNALLTDDKELKKKCLAHYIWDEIFASFHPSSKLFPMIMTMPYFLQATGHKNFEKYLRPYLETLRNFEWRQARYTDAIKDSIMRTFYNAQQHWQEHEYLLLLKILCENGFLGLVEDLVEEEDLKQVRDIQIQ